MKNWKIANFYEFKKNIFKFVKIRAFPEFLKFVKFVLSIYGFMQHSCTVKTIEKLQKCQLKYGPCLQSNRPIDVGVFFYEPK